VEKNEYRIKRLEMKLYELEAFKLLKKFNLDDWGFSIDKINWQNIQTGDKWPSQSFPCYFRKEFTIPDDWKGLSIRLQLWLDGEGIVYINNAPIGGLDPNHREFRLLERAEGGERFAIFVEAVPRGPFGSYIKEPKFVQARLVSIDTQIEAAIFDFLSVLDAAKNLSVENELQLFLIEALEDALNSVKFLSNTEEYLNMIGETRLGRELISRMWNPPVPQSETFVNPEEIRRSIIEAQKKLSDSIKEIKTKYPPIGKITLTGHSHIDLAWLWPMAETRRKIRRTFSTIISLMERFPEFRYNQSSAQIYSFLKEDEPFIYEKVKEKIKNGVWEPIGGMWVESDCNLTSGESLVRQFLYGQKFFEAEFGKKSKVAWLPDVFGFTWTLPQILKKAGLDYFLTTKLSWNETNRFPYDLFYWQGLDGTKVIAHFFSNPGHGYNRNIQGLDLLGTWQNYRQKTLYYNTLLSFGYGDGGGGPTYEMLEMYRRFKDFPGYPRLEIGTVEEFFEKIPRENLPIWDGELYLELHRGTYTSQSRTKKLNRLSEHLLYTAEVLSTLSYVSGEEYPQEELTDAWKKLLRNQFHDILPGSSIREVYEDAERELQEVKESAEKVIEGSFIRLLSKKTYKKKGIVIFNPNSFSRTLQYIGDIPNTYLELPTGKVIEVQRLPNGRTLIYDPETKVPSVGYIVLYISDKYTKNDSKKLKVAEDLLENERVRIRIGADGSITSFYDKESDREIFAERGNQLWTYFDRTRERDAWFLEPDYLENGEEVKNIEYIKVIETGPFRGVVEIKRRYRDSTILQRYILYQSSKRLDIETEIDWHERRVLLKALFPFDIRSSYATYEIAYGHIQRPTHKNTSWDWTKFEVPGHRWVDLSEGDYGVSILNDGKYGYGTLGSTITLSLLRSPIFPDFFADEGKHNFTYSIFVHEGDWRNGTVQEAIALNTPLVGKTLELDSTIKDIESFIEISKPNIVLGAMKKAEDEDGVVLRFYEAYGSRGKVKIKCNFNIKSVFETNLLEEESQELKVENNAIELYFKPYEIKTIKLL